jgi:hypothetical protein
MQHIGTNSSPKSKAETAPPITQKQCLSDGTELNMSKIFISSKYVQESSGHLGLEEVLKIVLIHDFLSTC